MASEASLTSERSEVDFPKCPNCKGHMGLDIVQEVPYMDWYTCPHCWCEVGIRVD